jgi:small subunit ribosomal protein S1
MTTDQPDLAITDAEATGGLAVAEADLDAPQIDTDLDTPVRTLDGPEYIEVDGEMVPNYDGTLPLFSEGDVVSGRVVRVDKDEVLVDIGYKSEGVIPLPELSIRKSVKPEDEVSLGEWVDALVMQKEDQDGRLILSKKRARFEKAWKRIEAAAAAGEHVEGTVIEVVKGGLILDLGVRGFLPASLVDIRRVQDLDEFLGRRLECKVIELNRNRNNVVLSRRAVLEDERREVRQKILDELQPGQVVEGVISNIVEFGAFVDLDGIDGLIHISELSWSHVNHPSEVLQIGEKVTVKVLDIDRDRQRISLGLKQTQADPWQSVIESYQVGDVVEGRVTKVVTFGAFVEIHAGVEGLVHISELAAHHVENPREVVNQGDLLAVRVIEIDADRRRLSLSLKRVADSDPIQHHLPDEIRNAAIADQGSEPPFELPELMGEEGDPEPTAEQADPEATAEVDEAGVASEVDEADEVAPEVDEAEAAPEETEAEAAPEETEAEVDAVEADAVPEDEIVQIDESVER